MKMTDIMPKNCYHAKYKACRKWLNFFCEKFFNENLTMTFDITEKLDLTVQLIYFKWLHPFTYHSSWFKFAGKWALRNVSRGYFLGAAPDKLICTAKAPADSEYWSVHIAARPQVTLKSVGRKRYAHLAENEDEIYVDSNVPWGADTLFTLEFRDGNYAIHSCNNKYLHRDGKLQVNHTKK